MAQLSSLHPCKFDVTFIDPQYTEVTWERPLELPIPALSPIWASSSSGSDMARPMGSKEESLAKWGFRCFDDRLCVNTNKTTLGYV